MEIESKKDEAFMHKAVGASLRIGFVALLLILSIGILKPFIAPLVWGVIFAVGIYPLHKKFTKLLKGRAKVSAIIITLIGLAIILVPVAMFTSSTVEGVTEIAQAIEEETFQIPPPDESVKEWPLIGRKTYEAWSLANSNATGLIMKYSDQLRGFAPKLTSSVMGVVGSVFLFIIALIISGALLLFAEPGQKVASKVFRTLVGDKGAELTELSMLTIRSVVQGVIGIAIIQSLFIGIGMYAISMPAAGILSIVVLILAIIQLPPMLVMIPVIIYVFSYAGTTGSIIFTVWTILWSIADSFLKPMFLGKGVDVPMLVVLLGAIGGMMMAGPVGLFVGSVVLALAYKIFIAMLEE